MNDEEKCHKRGFCSNSEFALLESGGPNWEQESLGQHRQAAQSHCWLITGWPRPTCLDLDQQDGFLCHTEASGFGVTLHSNTVKGDRFYTYRGKGLRPFCGFCSNSTQGSIFSRDFAKPRLKDSTVLQLRKKQNLGENHETKQIFYFHLPWHRTGCLKARREPWTCPPSHTTLIHLSLPSPYPELNPAYAQTKSPTLTTLTS